MTRFSASSTPLLSKCRRPFHPAAEWLRDEPGPDARRGTAVGQRATKFINGQTREELPLDEDGMQMWAALLDWLSVHKGPGWQAEIAIAYELAEDTARIIGRDIGREYPPGPLCGSIDILEVTDDAVVVTDIKCTQVVEKYWPQLFTLALFAARAYGRQKAIVRILHVTTDKVTPYERGLSEWDLRAWAGQLHMWLDEIPEAQPIPGPHCSENYCPHRLHCPATRDAVNGLVPAASLARFKMTQHIESAEHAAWMLSVGEAFEGAWYDLKDRLKAYAANTGGLPLDGGKVWRPVASTRRTADVGRLQDLARRKGATQAELDACIKTAEVMQWRKVGSAK